MKSFSVVKTQTNKQNGIVGRLPPPFGIMVATFCFGFANKQVLLKFYQDALGKLNTTSFVEKRTLFQRNL